MSETVLVVDDYADIRKTCRAALERHGYTVVEAKNGQEALERLKESLPTIVLLDIMMPDMSGLEVLEVIRANPKTSKLPVILLTAKSTDKDVLTGYQHDADYYVTKPYTPNELRYAVNLVLGRIEAAKDS